MGSIFFLFIPQLFAQEFTVTGTIYSEDGHVLEEAYVYLSEHKWAVTDETGFFQISSVPPGRYTITVSRLGYQKQNLDIIISSNEDDLLQIYLEELIYNNKAVVVTASRTAQELEDVPAPIDVISESEIQKSGASTLKDILLEQTGIALSPNEDNSIQMQGFESDYTLIMIDGQPLIGRTRGALDLSRINVSNVHQVEVVKGPSSALWGSDALAGVINIITRDATDPFSINAYSEYGSRNRYDLGVSTSFMKNKSSGTFGFASNGSDGFDLSEEEFGKNQNPFDAVSLNAKLKYEFSSYTSLTVSGRYFRNQFNGEAITTVADEIISIEESGWQDDSNLQVRFETSPISRLSSSVVAYSTRYEDLSDTFFEDPEEEDIRTNNRQGLDRLELQNDYSWNNKHLTTFGAGATQEFVRAERFQGERTQTGSFLFVQHQYNSNEKLYLIAGARLDNHSAYESYLSPKLAARYRINDYFTVRASFGQGFKAPDFRTLYLDFDNAGSGYRIYGTKNILSEIERFNQQSLVAVELVNDISALGSLEPEYSTSYNIGTTFLLPDEVFRFSVNAFRNNAKNLIDAREVVELVDGSTIFGYLNINEARTQGIEVESTMTLFKQLTASIGYQFLDAVELASEERTLIRNSRVVTEDVEFEVPLPKRPRHSGNIKLFYREPVFDTEFSLRGIIRGEYFFNDTNADGNAEKNVDEFVEAHTIWNLTIGKRFGTNFRVQIGSENLFNYTDSEFLRFQPGRTIFTRINFDL
ncbi:MAG: TonB-dependent receptor [Balneolales bacterium]|nr:TonB-dependent receptor [Balneolales bacterium]